MQATKRVWGGVEDGGAEVEGQEREDRTDEAAVAGGLFRVGDDVPVRLEMRLEVLALVGCLGLAGWA
jgi:hypothetical protein